MWSLLPRSLLAATCLTLALASVSAAQRETALRVGHWVVAKGVMEPESRLAASSLEVTTPGDEEALIGEVTRVSEDGSRFWIMEQVVQVSPRTRWRQIAIGDLLGQRVKVEGHYRGLNKFSARTVSPRTGRDRVEGRVDRLTRVPGGVRATIMRYRVFVPTGLEIEFEQPLDEVQLAPAVSFGTDTIRRRDDDDDLRHSIVLGDDLSLGLRLQWRGTSEDEFDLDQSDDQDRLDNGFTLRGEFLYDPGGGFFGLVGFRYFQRFRDDEDDGNSTLSDFALSEAYGMLTASQLPALQLQIGRQDFDERREWLYDQNLDAVRVIYTRPAFRVELSASTRLSSGSPRDEASDNLIAYLSNNDEDRHLAAYIVDRRDDRAVRDYPFHLGLRAFGDWLPQQDVWAELSVLRGFTDDERLEGYAFDLGTTWLPPTLAPWYFTAGFAFASGDDDAFDGTDNRFRQTGLQDNNDKFGGVTSFRYYGELFDPELSNMSILTLGIGRRLSRRTSLDLVYHRYRQDVVADFLEDSDVDADPNGLSRDLGSEVDLILGIRPSSFWNLEVVVARFEPDSAFDETDAAWLGVVQLRFNF